MKRAMTLLEVLIATSIFVIVIGLAFGVSGRTSSNVGETLVISDVAMKSSRLAEYLNQYLRSAQSYTLTATAAPNTAFTAVEFRTITGYDFDGLDPDGVTENNGIERSPVRLIRFVYDAGEDSTNGADDDGDGLIDEGSIELREDLNNDGDATDANELLAVLATNVDADSFSIQCQPSGGATPAVDDAFLQISYTIMRRLPRQGEIYTFTNNLEIAFRNSLSN